MADYTLSVDIKANDELSAALEKIKKNAEDFKKQVDEAGNKADNAGKKTADAGKKAADAGKQTADAGNQAQSAGKQAETAGTQSETAGKKIKASGDDAKKAGKDFKDASDMLKDAGEKMKSTGKTMQDVGGKLTKGVTTPLVGVGTASTKLAVDFETSMAKVSTIADSTQVPMDDLRKQILALSNDTGVAASDIAESVYSAISAGQSTGDAVNFVSNATKLAKAGFTDASTSLDVLTTIMNAYGSSAGSAESISNKLITTQNLGKTTVAELGSNMGKVIPTANMYGVSLDNVASAYVTTTKNGIATAESTTYINGMLNELGKAGSDVSKIIQEKTGKSFKELMDSGSSLTDVLGIVQSHCEETGISIGDVFSSQEAGKAAATLVQHAEDFNGAMVQMGQSANATQSAFDKMDDTKAAQMSKTINELKNSGIELGETLITTFGPAVSDLANKVTGAAQAFGQLSPEVQQMIVKGALAAAALGPLLTIGGKVVSGAGTVVTGIGKIAGGIGGLAEKAGSATSPVSSSATAVGSLSKNALGLVAAGAGILMASAGLALLAQSAIQVASAGPGAAVAMVGMVAAVGGLTAGAAALAPALTAGSVGLVAFGAGVALVGSGIFLATSGVTLLATQLPTVATYGGTAATNIAKLGAAMIPLAGGTVVVSAAMVTLGVGLTTAGAGGLVAAAGITTTSGSIVLLTGSAALLSAGLIGVTAQMRVISSTSKSSAKDLKSMVTSINVVKSGLDGLKTTAQNAVSKFVAAFSSGTPNARAAAIQMGNAVVTSLATSMAQAPQIAQSGAVGIANNMNAGLSTMNGYIQAQMQEALRTVQSTIAQMQSEFRNTSFEFNRNIALPHFNMSGNFNPETGAVPKTSVQWYRKGYDQSYMFNTPTVVGASGFGDGSGTEIVTGDEHLIDLMRSAFEGMGGGTTVIPVYIGQERIDELVVNATQRSNYRSGGR